MACQHYIIYPEIAEFSIALPEHPLQQLYFGAVWFVPLHLPYLVDQGTCSRTESLKKAELDGQVAA